jgi:hypothetical protein
MMNERILKIAGQNCVGEYHAGILCWRFSEDQLRKFAESIVRECAEQVKNLRVNDYGISGAEIIREHFGIE